MTVSVHDHDVSAPSSQSPVAMFESVESFHCFSRKYRYVMCNNDQSDDGALREHMNVLIQQL